MAARRWYLLIPLMAASGGVAWVAYNQMPASYTATAVYQVSTSTASDAKAVGKGSGFTIASHRAPPDPLAVAKSVATDLTESVHPQPPAGSAPGRPGGAQPVTVQLQAGTPTITVRAVADSVDHARDAVTTTTTQLTDRLHGIAEEQRALADTQLTLDAVAPVAYQPPVRTVGRRVGIATLLFCLAMSVLLAAAVERSAQARRRLAARAEGEAAVEEDRFTDDFTEDGSVPEAAQGSREERAAALVSRAGEPVPARAPGPVRTVTSARPAAPVGDDASEDNTAVIFPAPGAERPPAPRGTSEPQRGTPEPQRPADPERGADRKRAPEPQRAAEPPRAPVAARASEPNRAPEPGRAAEVRPGLEPWRGSQPPRGAESPRVTESPREAGPNRSLPAQAPPPSGPQAAPARPGRPVQRGGRAPMPPRAPRDTESPVPAVLATGGSPRPPAGPVPPGQPRRPDPRPDPPNRSDRGHQPPGARERREVSFDRPVNPYASPSGAFEPSGTRGPDRGGRQRGGSDEGRPALIGSELDSLGLDSLGLDSAGLDPLSADLGSSKSGPGPESLASSPLWLPVAQLPAETDGWLPSLAPDDELAPLPEPDRGSGRGVDALLGELPPTSYADDPPPLLALEATESTNVMPVHVDSEDDPLPGARGGAADADGYGVDREADRPATPDEDHALSTDVSLPHGSADDQGRRDDPLTSPDPAAAHPDAEHSVPAHADHDHPGPREPGASDPKPDRVEPARPGAAREAAQKVVQKVVQEVVQEVAEVREDPHPVGARPEAAPASGVQGAGRRPSARDEDGELEGWPGFDEQVRVQS